MELFILILALIDTVSSIVTVIQNRNNKEITAFVIKKSGYFSFGSSVNEITYSIMLTTTLLKLVSFSLAILLILIIRSSEIYKDLYDD